MTDTPSATPSRRMLLLVVALATLATIAIAALLVNIFGRKQEARNSFYRVVELNDTIDDPAVWGKNFPMQYDLYLRTVDMQRTKYGGSEAVRLIEIPKPRLMTLQRRILAGILEKIPPHPAVHGFVKSRSIKTYAAHHVGQRVVLRMDLQDFIRQSSRSARYL
jgi:hypothetical protein